MGFYGEIVTFGLLFVHVSIFAFTLSRIPSTDSHTLDGEKCFRRIWIVFRQRGKILSFFLLHIIDISFDFGVIIGVKCTTKTKHNILIRLVQITSRIHFFFLFYSGLLKLTLFVKHFENWVLFQS